MATEDTPLPTDAPPESSPVEAATTPEATDAPVSAKQFEGMAKAVQQIQQDFAQLARHKAAQGGTLTDAQETKLAQRQAEYQTLKAQLEGYVTNDETGTLGQTLAKAALVQAQENEELRTEIRRLSQRPQESPDVLWNKQKAKYPGVDVQKVWKESLATASNSPVVSRARQELEDGTLSQEQFDGLLQPIADAIYAERAKALLAPALPTASGQPPKPPTGRAAAPMPGAQPMPVVSGPSARADAILNRLSY